MSDFADKVRTVNFGNPRKRGPKTTVLNEHGSTRTEHWNDRVDVNIRPETVVWAPFKKENPGA